MEPDREYRPAASLGLRDAWRRRSLAGGWLAPDDWHSEAVDAVLAACRPGPLRYARLRRSAQATFGIQIRMIPLPGQLTEAPRLVDELTR
jgi:hypothetical protein